MALKVSVINELPLKARRSARESECSRIIDQAREVSPRYVMVTAETHEDFQRVYKLMIQHKRRHELDAPFNMRKLGDQLFVWITEEAA
jgi:hypothetical protein